MTSNGPQSNPAALRRRELGAFLRAHRERLAPGAVGLPSGARRRTPGLRREEVAALSGVGVAWYTWLEQGRVETSREVLESVGRALRLDAEQRGHVLRLGGYAPLTVTEPPNVADGTEGATGAGRFGGAGGVPGALRRMIDAWEGSPALVLDPVLGIVGWNSAYLRVWPDPGGVAEDERNLLLLLLGDGAHQRLLLDWEEVGRDLHRHFRAFADGAPDDRRVREVSGRLESLRPDLAHWWRCREVASFAPRTVRLAAGGRGDPVEWELSLVAPAVGGGGLSVLVQTRIDRADRGDRAE
ncbi:helix-turn-helix domain-containing protein [Streptomyces sp. NPDC059578]|uniref:helix-turn-helix domain-containing protein n=1 Tax=Streptomyces sp. NPDC059578 TaxID=3346874 RepID=UPI0036859858